MVDDTVEIDVEIVLGSFAADPKHWLWPPPIAVDHLVGLFVVFGPAPRSFVALGCNCPLHSDGHWRPAVRLPPGASSKIELHVTSLNIVVYVACADNLSRPLDH